MTTAADQTADTFDQNWSADVPQVRRALAFIRRKHGVTAEELVAWDAEHGRRLFDWNDSNAAEEWRRQQARVFLNRFRGVFDKMRVRAFIHVREDEQAAIEQSAYYTVEAIAEHKGMRAQVIEDIARRAASLMSELAMWKLSTAEQDELFERLHAAILGKTDKAA